jgi:tRNA 2-thiouridine synthesizing protein A
MERHEGRENMSSAAVRRMEEGGGLHSDAEWDAGDMGCGELVLELRMRLQPMQPGQLFKLTARDPGALEDLPAWCRLTGHRLVMAVHPVYWIGRRED